MQLRNAVLFVGWFFRAANMGEAYEEFFNCALVVALLVSLKLEEPCFHDVSGLL